MRIVCPYPQSNRPSSTNVRGPVSFTQSHSIIEFPTIAERNLETFHALWKEIHGKENPTKEWFLDWCNRVPQISCGCKQWLAEYLISNPPRYDDWPKYTWEMHNAVTAKVHTTRQPFSWNEFLVIYPQ